MAKIPFTKLGLTKSQENKILNWNGQAVEVKQYLPIEEKLTLMTNILQKSIDDKNFHNPCRVDLYKTLEMIFAYTNISATDKQKEDIFKLYDLFICSGFSKEFFETMNPDELDYINNMIAASIKSIYEYQTSALGVLENLNSNYENVSFDINNIMKQIADKENVGFLAEVMDKMG